MMLKAKYRAIQSAQSIVKHSQQRLAKIRKAKQTVLNVTSSTESKTALKKRQLSLSRQLLSQKNRYQ